MPKQDRYCLATLRSQLLDHPVAPGEWHARRSYHGQPGLWIPGLPLRSAPDDGRQAPRSGAINHAADAFFGFLKNPFQDQRMKTTNMFLNIFFVHRNSTAAAEHGSDLRNPGERWRIFCQSNGRRRAPKGVPTMLRKTMIVLAKASALNSGLTVDAFAHGGGRGHGGSFGAGGHMDGFSGARIGSGFGSGFASSHFGAALGLALFGLVLASFAGKAADDDEQGRKACMYDALTVCAKFIPDREQIANCLMANRERISQSCRVLLARAH